MFLSEAIEKRQKLLERADAMNRWFLEQSSSYGQLKWHEMKVAINAVIDQAFEEYHKYNNAIENDIQQLEIEILPFNVK